MPKILTAHEMSKCIGCFTCMSMCSMVNHKNHSVEKSAIRVKTSGGMSGSLMAIVCLGCKDASCMEVCSSDALSPKAGGGVTLNKDKCIGCKKCLDACVAQAITFDETEKKPIICKHCGVCANFCPHGCLSLTEV